MEDLSSNVTPDQPSTNPGGAWLLRFLADILETLILAVVLFVGINFITARIRVDGSSMEPTLHSGEFVIVNKLAYKLSLPELGDIIVFHFPRDPKQEYIKRVIGLPGDQVTIQEGKVFVNGQEITEPYISAPPVYPGNSWQIPDGQLFVLGDNRNNSSDSHNWGTVPMDYVVGKALFVYWPLDSWGTIDHISTASAAP